MCATANWREAEGAAVHSAPTRSCLVRHTTPPGNTGHKMARKAGSRGWGHIRKLPSGRFQASYIGPDRHRHTAPITYSNRPRAEGWLADERKLIELDAWTSPADRAAARAAAALTLTEFASKWIAERNVKHRTKLMYEGLLRQHIDGGIGKLALTAVTPERVRTWFADLGTEHVRRNSHAYGLLHAVMATAVTDGLIAANPCAIKRAMNPQRKREPVILDVPELADLADRVPERYKALILISAWCGLRWGEVIELRRKDIDVDVLFVGRGATHQGGCHVDTPKSGKPRAVVIPPHIRADLKHHLDTFTAKDAEAQVFPAQRGGCHLNDSVFRKAIAKPLNDIGRGNLRIHDLRHFSGTVTAQVATLAENMARMGHSTVRASLIYQGTVSGRDAQVAAALSELAAAQVQAGPNVCLEVGDH